MKYFLAVDIGASSGRHILAHLENGRIVTEEIYRFPNGMTEREGESCWDLESLFGHIKEGMKRCAQLNRIPVAMGIDTWAVDFVLLDSENRMVGQPVGYRDKRTEGMDERVYESISESGLYERTGIQKQIFNTIYQLMAVKEKKGEQLERARTLLMIPDYFHYLLTGVKGTEYTNSTTTQLVSPVTRDWDMELIESLGYPARIFQRILKPGTVLGTLTPEIEKEAGFSCQVVLPATHDTASAVLAVPSGEDKTLYISSGTWSLMGVERMEADCSEESRRLNLTNEGGYEYRFRYLKNIMGLWMIQSLKKELKDQYTFAQLCDMAAEEEIPSLVDCNDQRFLAPDSMIEAVKGFCKETGQQEPRTPAEYARVIYHSLADCYKRTVKELEKITGHVYDRLHIVGGGANAGYLNELTARATKKTVLAGPTEATAIGNLLVQMISRNELGGLKEARECVYRSFNIEEYH